MKIIDFKMNTNPLGPPKWMFDELSKNARQLIEYPDYNNVVINNAISEFLNLPVDNVAVANGSIEAIYAAANILGTSHSTIITPTYWGYAAALDASKISYNELQLKEENNFAFDIDAIGRAAKKSTLLFICNPNNPTGSFIGRGELLPIVRDNPTCHFFIDEAHLIFRDDYSQETLVTEVIKLSNLTVIYSTSKVFNIGGLRTGIVASNRSCIEKFKKFQVPYSFGSIPELLFPKLLQDHDFLSETRKELPLETAKLEVGLRALPWLKIYPVKTHFILCKILSRNITAGKLTERLAADGFGIRDASTSAGLEGEFIRISSNTELNNQKLIDQIKNYNIV